MLVQGQPKTAAEYIQATSRVGREGPKPGLVVTLLNIHKPRDRTHYEQFRAFHMSFYRAVEATSVTPFADRAMDRALAATLVAAMRHVEPDLTPSKAAERVAANEQAFAVVEAIVREKLKIAVQPNEVEAVSARCLSRLAALKGAWIDIADKQTANGDEFAYDKAEPVRRLLQDPLDPLPGNRAWFAAGRSMRDTEPVSLLKLVQPPGVTLD